MSPTFEAGERFRREYLRLPATERRRFLGARDQLVDALRSTPPSFPRGLRVKGVQGHPGVFEMTWAPDGRATFEFGDEREPGTPHVIWRRIGDHSIFRSP